MNTPKQQASWLESFPPDIWSYFSWYLPGEQLERLMITGAMLLRQRLTSHRTVKSIKLGEDFMIFKSLTRLFNDFPYVDELYIYSLTDEWSDRLGLMIDSMPFGLRKLELRGLWKKTADTLFDKDGATLKLNEHLPRLEVLDLMRLSCSSFTWMVHSPQSLTKLSLFNWDGSVELPTSLIHFESCKVTLSTSSFVSKLPPSLETFNVLQILEGADLLIPLLPTSTRKLCIVGHMRYSSDPRTSGNLVEQLPKSLTRLEVPSRSEIKFATNPELVSHLPSILTELHIRSTLHCSGWRLLPRRLTKLSFFANQSYSAVPSKTVDSHGAHHEVYSIPFDYFPRSITSLKMSGGEFFCGPPTTFDGSYFPPQLKHLEISSIQLSPETAKLLPSSLNFLAIRNLCERVCEHLPNSIKTLESSFSILLTPNLIKFLPKSLTSLRLTVSRSTDSWYDGNTGRAIDSLEQYPLYSIQNDCVSPSFDWKDHSPLPSTLTKLHIGYAYELGDTFLQHQLPNLTQLHLSSSKRFTDLSIPHLPPHLTYLNLEYSSTISGKSFKFLPRGLTFLNLSDSESIFDCDIEHLPRTLKHALLSHAIHLSDICIRDLPPHLELLRVESNSQISTSCFPKLPYPLRSPQINRSVDFANWQVSSGILKLKNSPSAK